MRIPRIRISIRWLMAAVAVVGLLLGLGVAYLRSRDPYLTIRVFNKTRVPLHDLGYQYDNLGPEPLFGSYTVSGAFGTSEVLAPGGMTSWDAECPHEARFTFRCRTPDGTEKSGQATVNVGTIYSSFLGFHLDFYVEPSGVKSFVGVGSAP
jgi:hypothetical protein